MVIRLTVLLILLMTSKASPQAPPPPPGRISDKKPWYLFYACLIGLRRPLSLISNFPMRPSGSSSSSSSSVTSSQTSVPAPPSSGPPTTAAPLVRRYYHILYKYRTKLNVLRYDIASTAPATTWVYDSNCPADTPPFGLGKWIEVLWYFWYWGIWYQGIFANGSSHPVLTPLKVTETECPIAFSDPTFYEHSGVCK